MFFLLLLIILNQFSNHTSSALSARCDICCPLLFNNPHGVVKVGESSPLKHTLSYIIRCLSSTDEVILVSDDYLSAPTSIDVAQNNKDNRKGCIQAANVPVSLISATSFLEHQQGLFQKFIPASGTTASNFSSKSKLPNMRTNFVFETKSAAQMQALIAKVEQELQLLRTDIKIFWQPYVIFLWSEIQHDFRNLVHNPILEVSPSSPEERLMNSWFQKYRPRFGADSGIFFCFMVQKGNSSRSRTNLFLSFYEMYGLKGEMKWQRINSMNFPGQESQFAREERDCTRRSEQSVLEKVNSYLFIGRFNRRAEFRNVAVVASVLKSSEWVTVQRNENGSLILSDGAAAQIFSDIQSMMGFKYEIQLGVEDKDTTSEAMKDDPQLLIDYQGNTDNADISLDQWALTPARARNYSFLQPTYFGIFQAFFTQPPADKIRNIVSAPFTATLWITLFTTWLIIIGCISGWGYIGRKNYILCTTKDSNFIQEIGMWTVAAICQKSWYISPNGSVFKSIFCIGSFSALVCYAAYSAMIVSFLTVNSVPVQELEDLIEYNYKFTVHEESEATQIVAQGIIDSFKLSQKLIQVTTAEEISHIIHNPYHAFLSYPDLFYRTAAIQMFKEDFVCSTVSKVAAYKTPFKSAMSVKKGSQLQELFSEKLLVVLERGLIYRYKMMYDGARPMYCSDDKVIYETRRKDVEPVRFTDVFTAFVVIFVGWFASIWIWCVEKAFRRQKKLYYLV